MLETNEYTLETVMKKSTALLIIDMQNDFVHHRGVFSQSGFEVGQYQTIIPVIKKLIERARQANMPIIWVAMSHNEANNKNDAWIQRRQGKKHPQSCSTGTWGADIIEQFEPMAEDTIVWKHRYSAFVETNMHQLLTEKGIESIVAVGINTNTCVESTLRDAHMLGYHVVLPKDATTCVYLDAYEPSLNNIERHFGLVCTSEELIHVWYEKANSDGGVEVER
ncbi:cysteine hydrolase [Paenibacillus camelliae]|uniref:cysteine hydrolase n=1 Tax=Paenibacillus camelliae TaxID=512410 RepID=UPI00203C1375|nr:cysteine hydrolase [Paenibacillus camelliae]